MHALHLVGAMFVGLRRRRGRRRPRNRPGGQDHAAEAQQKITVEFKDERTQDVFKTIENEPDKPLKIKIDNVSGISNNTKVTYKAKDKTIEDVLNELSDKLECGWVVISNVSNNKVDGWVVIRKNTKGKERGYEAGKEPKKTSVLRRCGRPWRMA